MVVKGLGGEMAWCVDYCGRAVTAIVQPVAAQRRGCQDLQSRSQAQGDRVGGIRPAWGGGTWYVVCCITICMLARTAGSLFVQEEADGIGFRCRLINNGRNPALRTASGFRPGHHKRSPNF